MDLRLNRLAEETSSPAARILFSRSRKIPTRPGSREDLPFSLNELHQKNQRDNIPRKTGIILAPGGKKLRRNPPPSFSDFILFDPITRFQCPRTSEEWKEWRFYIAQEGNTLSRRIAPVGAIPKGEEVSPRPGPEKPPRSEAGIPVSHLPNRRITCHTESRVGPNHAGKFRGGKPPRAATFGFRKGP